MKTIKFLLLIIGLSLVSFLGQAQSSFTVGASASTATTGLTPLTLRYIGFGTLQNHVLYRASSLTVLQGAKIEKMVFYTNVSNVTFANATYKGTYTVKMKTVPAATLNAFSSATTSVPDMTGAITVVSSATATVNSSGEVVMTFTTPFTYTGDNLLMEFAVARGANTFTNTATPKFLAVSSGYSSGRYIYKSASTATKESTGVESFLPKTTFYYTANYTVGTSVSPVNRGSVTGGGTFTAGASATLTATPAAGYEFEKWTNLSGGALLSTDNPYTFAVNSNIDVVANFKEGANYTVTAIPGEGGTVGGSGGSYSGATYTGEYPVNAEITMTATPDEGYRFVNWTNSGSSTVSTDAAYTFNVTGNETLTAHFIATYTITPSITLITTPPDVGSAGGAITPSGPVTLDKGQNQMFTFTPDVGFRIKEVLVNGTPNAGAKTNGYYTFTDVQSNQTIDVEFMRDQNTHELTAGATHGTITPDGVTAVIENNNQTFTFAPESACYELTEVWIDGVKDAAALSAALSSLNSGSYTHTFTSVAGTHTIEVVFAIKRYTIGVAAAQLEVSGNMVDGGTVSPSTDTYDCGANVQLTATTYTGFKFVKWENQTSSQTYSSNPLAITVSGNADYVAHFEKLPELVTVPNGTGATPALATTDLPPIAIGDISAAAQHNQILYRSRYLTNLLNKDITKIVFYHTRNSSDINVAVKCTVKLMMMDASTDRLSELVDVTEATTVIASGTILIKADDGTFTLELDQPYRYTGGALLMDITVPKGAAYSVVNFHNYTSDNYLHQSRIGAVGYAMVPKTDFHYETRYLLDVSASPTAGGSADVAPEGPYVSGTPVMLTAAPNEGYRFVKWADGQGATVSTDKVHSFNVTDNGTFTAQYMATYTVTATPTAGGSIAGDGYSPATGSGVYDHGTPVTLTATPNPGYRFVNWTDGSSSLTNNAAYTFNVDANRALTANFVATYTVSASASQGGAIAPAGDSIVDHGAGVDYRFTPDLGWVLQAVLVDGENVSAGAGSYTLSNITGNRTIEAIFNQTTNTYTLTATTGMGGSVAPAAATVLEGANHTFVFTTNPGYELTKILIDGEENAAALGEALANSGSYTFTNITANRTIRAEYTAAFYTIDAVASPAVGGTVSGGGQIGKNAPVTLEATPNPGYGFVNWTKAGHEVSDEATYTFNAPGDGLYVAHFEQQPATITVADNANTNEDVPMNLVATSSTHHAQIIYRASELTGITSGSRITKMVFYHNKSANTLGNTTKCTVKIMSTGSASFPSAAFADVTSATTVVNNATISLSDNGELILTFATPYTYTGGNVLVDVSIASTFAGVGGITFYGVSVGYNAACWQQKTGTIQNAQFLPKTKFESEGVPVPRYTITTAATSGGAVTQGAGTYDAGETVTLTAVPDPNHRFVRWTAGSSNVEVSQEASCTFTASRDSALTAHFVRTYKIATAVAAGGGGGVTGAGTYDEGAMVTLTATPNLHYRFDKWTTGLEETTVSTESPHTFTANSDMTLVAHFVEAYNITAVAFPLAGGSITGTGPFDAGAAVTLTAVANTGYRFDKWTLTATGAEVSTANPFAFTLDRDTSLTARFIKTHTIAAQAVPSAGGTITYSPETNDGIYDTGTEVTLTAVPNAGYRFVDWTETGGSATSDPARVVVADKDRTLEANFMATYTITAVVEIGGTVTGEAPYNPATNSGIYDHGADVSLIATADHNYKFISWIDADADTLVSTANPYTFQAGGNINLKAHFAAIYTITVVPGAGGNAWGGGTFTAGSSATVTAVPNDGYHFVDWTEDEVPVHSDPSYTFTVSQSRTLTANFEQDQSQYAVTYNQPANGTLTVTAGSASVASGALVDAGADIVITATPAAGYELATLTVNGQPFASGGTHTVNETTTIACSFELIPVAQHTVTYDTPDNGTLTVMAGSSAVASGASVDTGTDIVITATPAADYELATLTVNGQPFTNGGTHTVNGATTIACSFELISVAQHTVTYTTPENGTLTVMAGSNAVASGTSVDTGTDIVITATPAADYELAMLTVNGQPFTNGGTHTVNGATTIACSFELISAAQHTVTYATPDNGTLTVMAGSNAVASGASVDTGTDIVITATPDAGYQLATLTVNGQPFVSGETHTVNEASTIVCSFEEKPNITELLINNIPVGEISDTMTYDVACGDTDVILGITANGNIAISVGSTDYSNNPTIPLSKDKVTISIGITAGTATTSFALDVIKPLGSAATPMYVERWGSTLAIVNNPANNGGHTFDDYRWYLNGAAMEGSNGGYILLNGRPATAYSAEVHSLTTDVWHKLCDDRAATPQAHIVAYPNPVKAGQTLYLNLPDGVDKVTVRLYDMNGNLKKQQSGVQQAVSMPNQHGIYLMQVQLPNGNVETQRIIVE